MLKVLHFLCLSETGSKRLSVASILMWIVVVKLARSTDTSVTDLGALFVTLGHATYKHWSESRKETT